MKYGSISVAAHSTAKILLIDGNQNGLTARGMILREQGYVVETASTGEEAWDVIQAGHFDVLIATYRLKGMTGVELISRVHAAGSPARIILLLTHAESLSLDATKMGADEIISKGNREVAELLRAVRKLADSKPKRRPASVQKARAGVRRTSADGSGTKASGI